MTKADARVLLRDCGGLGELEAWIAERRWRVVRSGWVAGRPALRGWLISQTTSKIASISTVMPNGSAPIPTAERACRPRSVSQGRPRPRGV
jgi:hypothetical protein